MRQVNELRAAKAKGHEHYRRSARLLEEVTADHDKENTPRYTVSVQVHVLGLWFTVWSETCDVSDGDTRRYIQNCALETIEKLNEKI